MFNNPRGFKAAKDPHDKTIRNSPYVSLESKFLKLYEPATLVKNFVRQFHIIKVPTNQNHPAIEELTYRHFPKPCQRLSHLFFIKKSGTALILNEFR